MRGGHALVLSAIFVLAPAGQARAQSARFSAAEVAAACAPMLTPAPAEAQALRVVGSQDSVPRSLFGPHELVIVNGGTLAGVRPGQDYFIRRAHLFGPRPSSDAPRTVDTAGWLRILSVNETTAIARIDATCDAVLEGDYLEPFTPPVAVAAEEGALSFESLDFSSLSRVMFGTEERRLDAAGQYVLLVGGDAPLAVGSRVALYRDLRRFELPLTPVGEGVIVSVTNGTPLMRITTASDAVQSGDYVVPRR